MKNRLPSEIFPKETKVFFRGGNFIGMEGTVKNVEDYCTEKNAFYGFKIQIELENGKMINAYKSEHLQKL